MSEQKYIISFTKTLKLKANKIIIICTENYREKVQLNENAK